MHQHEASTTQIKQHQSSTTETYSNIVSQRTQQQQQRVVVNAESQQKDVTVVTAVTSTTTNNNNYREDCSSFSSTSSSSTSPPPPPLSMHEQKQYETSMMMQVNSQQNLSIPPPPPPPPPSTPSVEFIASTKTAKNRSPPSPTPNLPPTPYNRRASKLTTNSSNSDDSVASLNVTLTINPASGDEEAQVKQSNTTYTQTASSKEHSTFMQSDSHLVAESQEHRQGTNSFRQARDRIALMLKFRNHDSYYVNN